MKNGPQSSTKNDAEKHTPQIQQNIQITTPTLVPKSVTFSQGGASRDTFGGPNRFVGSKVGPQRSQRASNNRKMIQK